jgi:hypothetical protein
MATAIKSPAVAALNKATQAANTAFEKPLEKKLYAEEMDRLKTMRKTGFAHAAESEHFKLRCKIAKELGLVDISMKKAMQGLLESMGVSKFSIVDIYPPFAGEVGNLGVQYAQTWDFLDDSPVKKCSKTIQWMAGMKNYRLPFCPFDINAYAEWVSRNEAKRVDIDLKLETALEKNLLLIRTGDPSDLKSDVPYGVALRMSELMDYKIFNAFTVVAPEEMMKRPVIKDPVLLGEIHNSNESSKETKYFMIAQWLTPTELAIGKKNKKKSRKKK